MTKEAFRMKVRVISDAEATEPIIELHVTADYSNLDQLVTALTNFNPTPVTLTVSQHGTTVQLPLNQIMFIEATGHVVAVHTPDAVYRVARSLTELTTRLPRPFMRISKSALVNVTHIHALTKSLTGNLVTFNHSPKQLYASRRYYRDLKQTLEHRGEHYAK